MKKYWKSQGKMKKYWKSQGILSDEKVGTLYTNEESQIFEFIFLNIYS